MLKTNYLLICKSFLFTYSYAHLRQPVANFKGLKMVLTERELLIKIEHQLASLSDSHKEVLSEISNLFSKQDRDSKLLAVLTSEFKNHIEASKSNKEESVERCLAHRSDVNSRMSKTEGHIEKLFAELESERIVAVTAQNKADTIPGKLSDMKESLEKFIINKVNDEASERENFELKVMTYVKSSKLFISLVAFLITLVTSLLFPLIITLVEHWLK